MALNFGIRLAEAVKKVGVPLALGLDPHLDRLPLVLKQRFETLAGPEKFQAAAKCILEFNAAAIQAAKGQVAAVKPQFAFYEQLGAPGMRALEETCTLAKTAGLLIIGDAKRGDISSTAAAYARAIIDPDGPLGCDSITVNPWMGVDTLLPYLPYCEKAGRGLFVLLRTTNPGAALLQLHGQPTASNKLADQINEMAQIQDGWSSIGAVVGAMTPEDAIQLRAQLPHSWFLVPGVGAQGGSLRAALAGTRDDGLGSLVVCSRALLYPQGHNEPYETNWGGYIAQQIATMRGRFADL